MNKRDLQGSEVWSDSSSFSAFTYDTNSYQNKSVMFVVPGYLPLTGSVFPGCRSAHATKADLCCYALI